MQVPEPWNLAELRQYCRDSHTCSDPAIEIIDSIGRYTEIFEYHFEKARDAMSHFLEPKESTQPTVLRYIMSAAPDQREFNYAHLVSEASILAALHSIRAMYDVFAQLVNISVLNHSLSSGDVNIFKVRDRLNSSQLKTEIDELLRSEWFRYISAFINTAKHGKLIDYKLRISNEDSRYGMIMREFSYKATTFEAKWLDDLLNGMLETKNRILTCGKALNAQLR